MINVSWLPVQGETCDRPLARKRKKTAKIRCELPPNHQTEFVGGLIYPWHLGRNKAMRWFSWR